MENKSNLLEPLLERAEALGKTSYELIRLKSLDKTADVSSTILSRLVLVITLSIFFLILNVGASLWIGELLGKNYYGFLVVAAFDGLLATILYFAHPRIKTHINNFLVSQLLN